MRLRIPREKEVPDFDHTYCVQGLNITTSQNSITENRNKLNSLYWYKAIVRCTHVVARILEHGYKFNLVADLRWTKYQIKVFTICQVLIKFACMLQDIKNYQPVTLPKYSLHFWYCAKKKKNNNNNPITNIFNHVNTDWQIISLLNTVTEKK